MIWTFFIFLFVTLGLMAGFQLLASLRSSDRNRVRQRFAREFQQESATPAVPLFNNLQALSLDRPVETENNESSLPAPTRRTFREQVDFLLEQAAVPLGLNHMVLAMVGLGLILGAVGFFAGGLWLALPAALLACVVPWFFLYVRIQRRRDKLLKQLPAAFELMARVLRAGSSVQRAIQAVIESMEDPLAREFSQCQKQLDLGMPPEVTYQGMAQRFPILELRIFAMGMMIQRQTGGNLSEVLDRLAGLVRARLRLRQQVRALTAEGRMQGWTLVALPFVVFGAMLLVNHDYAVGLLDHAGLLAGTAVSMVLGMLWIRKIVNFEP